MMYKRGKKVQTNRKYTYDEMREAAVKLSSASLDELSQTLMDIAIMAYIDTSGQSAEPFIDNLNKYIEDFRRGEFTVTALKKYNSDSIKEFLANE